MISMGQMIVNLETEIRYLEYVIDTNKDDNFAINMALGLIQDKEDEIKNLKNQIRQSNEECDRAEQRLAFSEFGYKKWRG